MAAVSEQRLGGHCGQQVRQVGELSGCSRRDAGERAHERGAVEQRQPLLGLERERLQAQLSQHLAGVARLPVEGDPRIAGDRTSHVGKRNQVATGPARAALGDLRHDVVVEQFEQSLHQLHAHAGVALGQAVGPQQHRDPHDLWRRKRTGPATHEPEQILLQLGRLGRGDLPVRAVAQSGGHAVDRDFLGDQGSLQLETGGDGVGRGRRQRHRPVAARYGERIGDRERGAVQLQQRPLPKLL